MWSQYSAMAQHGELGEPVNLRPFSGSRGANRIMTVGAVSASIPIDPSARSIRLVNSGSSICYVRIGQGEQTATSADVAVFGNSEVVLSKGEGEGTLAFISASGTTLQAQTGSGGTVPGYQVVDQLFLTGDGVTQSGQLVDQFGRTVKPVGDAALTRTDWQGRMALSTSARTNLLCYSEQIDSWNKRFVTVTVNAVAAPNGTTTADKLVETTGSGQHYAHMGVSVESGKYLALSIHAKAGERTGIRLDTSGWVAMFGTPAHAYGHFDLTSGAILLEYGCTARIKPVGGGWYRCTLISLVPAITSGIVSICPSPLINGTTYSYIGDGSSGLYVWGGQGEVFNSAPAGPTPYIPTTAAPVTVTDYTASGTTLTLAEVPALAAELTVDGTGVNLPLLQIGG